MYKSYDDLGNEPDEKKDMYDVVEVQDRTHRDTILRTHRLVCIDLYALWCQPCKQTAPEYSMLANKYNSENEVAIVKENYTKKLSGEIDGLPTYLFYVDGQLVHQITGANIPEVEKSIQKFTSQIRASTRSPSDSRYAVGEFSTTGTGPQYLRSSIKNNRQGIPDTVNIDESYDPNVSSYKNRNAQYYSM